MRIVVTQRPECGTAAARTRFIVTYRAAGGTDVAEFASCCRHWDHEPEGFAILIDEAEVLQIDIADGHEQEITTNETVTTRENPAPGRIEPADPWAWTLTDDLPATVVPIDEIVIQARPKPGDHNPDCGETAAGACWKVTYYGRQGLQFDEFTICCLDNRPPAVSEILDEFEVIELSLADGYEQAIVTCDGTTRRANPTPGHIIAPGQPWAWTAINGLPSTFDPGTWLTSGRETG